MTGIGHIAQTAGTGALVARAGLARVEKARNSSDLGQQRMDDPRHRAGHDAHLASHDLSQSETGEHAPLWYGPRLRPAFVAQVLGQVMGTRDIRDPQSVFAAYEDRAACGPARRGFERKI